MAALRRVMMRDHIKEEERMTISRPSGRTAATLGATFFMLVSLLAGGAATAADAPGAEQSVAADGYTCIVAGIASKEGAQGTFWKSMLSVTNFSGFSVDLVMIYRYDGGTVTRNHTIGMYETVAWDNVATSLFGVSGPSSGAVEVQASSRVVVQARTYNDTPDGTFGQYLPGVSRLEMLDEAVWGLLGQLRNTSGFRTNVGFVNLGTTDCEVKVMLRDETGTQIGYNVWDTVPAGEWMQINDIFSEALGGSADLAYATIEVHTSGCTVWAYASVVDNDSGDATTIPVVAMDWL